MTYDHWHETQEIQTEGRETRRERDRASKGQAHQEASQHPPSTDGVLAGGSFPQVENTNRMLCGSGSSGLNVLCIFAFESSGPSPSACSGLNVLSFVNFLAAGRTCRALIGRSLLGVHAQEVKTAILLIEALLLL